MRICISATANSLDAPVDPRFGRCPYFIIVDLETMQFEAVPNPASGAMGGAGIQAGIKIITGAYGTVREVVEKYKRGELKETNAPTVGGHFGMGMGGGRGWRRRQW